MPGVKGVEQGFAEATQDLGRHGVLGRPICRGYRQEPSYNLIQTRAGGYGRAAVPKSTDTAPSAASQTPAALKPKSRVLIFRPHVVRATGYVISGGSGVCAAMSSGQVDASGASAQGERIQVGGLAVEIEAT